MNRSETIAELAKALAKAQGEMENAKKDALNPGYRSTYADLAAVVDAIKKPLSDNGIAYVQTTDTEDGTVTVETTLFHASGEWLSSQLRMRPAKDDPQGIGSCITYARRYSLQAIVGLAAEDDDGNAASEVGQKAAPQRTHGPTSAPRPMPKPKLVDPATSEIPYFVNTGEFLKWCNTILHLPPSEVWKECKTFSEVGSPQAVTSLNQLHELAEGLVGMRQGPSFHGRTDGGIEVEE